MKKQIFFENLNGLRFLCFLSVFFHHSFYNNSNLFDDNAVLLFLKNEIFGNGNLGVNFFFVLSGFLITYLLIEEKKSAGKINIGYFWMRRILRIWPLYFASILFGFVLFPILKQALGQTPNETANILYFITFLSNFDLIKSGLPDASTLGVLWSVGIEEQFYLIWPLILSAFPIKKYWIPFSIIIICSLIFRLYYNSYLMHEFHTLSCISDMTIGSLGAWLVLRDNKVKLLFKKLNKKVITLLYTIFMLIYFFRDEILFQNETIKIFERLIIAVVILFIILEQNYSENSLFKMKSYKRISKLGEITYGLYVLHFIGILITINITNSLLPNEKLWHIIILDLLLSLLISVIISKISFQYFEKPFLNLKRRYSSSNR